MENVLSILEQQENLCVFNEFGPDTAWRIGCDIRDAVAKIGASALIDVTVGGVCYFHCAVGSPTPHNQTWITRKRRTVLEFWKSSYRVTQEILAGGKNLATRGLNETDYALSGGGFPIRIRNSGVIGVIACSGMVDTMDHQLIVNAIARELNVKVQPIVVE